ncbi:MAG TPA: PDZ domain-containing protein [Firmicutes bacterium]|nr:PDZ domain-containing protein [Bacillota bacterium]
MVVLQYRRAAALEQRIWGVSFNNLLEVTLRSLGLGLLGGAVASLILVIIGVSLSESGIEFLLPLALLLYAVNPRLMCFSYAGGIISLLHLITGFPNVNVAEIMALVAILHVTESLLIWVSGERCASPIYTRNAAGKLVGGFSLQSFWPVPLVALFMLTVSDPNKLEGLIQMPDWWPMIRGAIQDPSKAVFAMVPITAALGYSDLAITMVPAQKVRRTSAALAVYSISLLGLSLLAMKHVFFEWLAALFGPAGHEIVATLGGRNELSGEPLFVSPERGVKVLGVVPGSQAEVMRIRPGDVILEVNGCSVNSRAELMEAFANSGWFLELKMVGVRGNPKNIEFRRPMQDDLGVITVPETGDPCLVELGPRKNFEWFRRVAVRIGGWLRRISGRD